METTTTTSIFLEVGSTLLMAGIVAAFTGFVTYWFGFRQYLKQRRWERVRKTYIENGLERVLDGTDKLSTACYLNYGKALLVFGLLENSVDDPEKSREVAKEIFSEMESVNLAPNYGMLKLAIFNNQSLIVLVTQMWTEFQQLRETIHHIGWQVIKDYFSEYKKYSEDKRRALLLEKKNIIREEWNKVIKKYEPLKGYLLCLQIEVDKMDLLCVEDIDKIAEQREVKKIIKEIEVEYKDPIEKFKGEFRENHE